MIIISPTLTSSPKGRRSDKLMELRGDKDDILIIKNGKVTDTSYANVVLSDKEGKCITPNSTYLLHGTRRASLLKSGKIRKAPVKCQKIWKTPTLLKLLMR